MKSTIFDLAYLGGEPLFERVRPIGQLDLPAEEVFFNYAKEIFEKRRLTNNGPLVRQLEDRLASLHGTRYCISFANASLAIVLLLRQLAGGQSGEVIMPAFTYPGLPHLAQWAGLIPRFCDIAPDSHAIDPDAVKALISDDSRVILAVTPANSPCDVVALEGVAKDSGIALCYDSVHGVGCQYMGKPIGGFGVAEVFSLHATKLINGFEGGYITTNDEALAMQLSSQRNFGFDGKSGQITGLGMNAKLNELHASLALASLERLELTITNNKQRYEAYIQNFSDVGGLSFLAYQNYEKANYEFSVMEVLDAWPLSRDETVALLRSENALARPYYSPPLHHSSHCPSFIIPPTLPVTEALAKSYIQMPVGELVSVEDIERLADWFRFVYDNGLSIKSAMQGAGND